MASTVHKWMRTLQENLSGLAHGRVDQTREIKRYGCGLRAAAWPCAASSSKPEIAITGLSGGLKAQGLVQSPQ